MQVDPMTFNTREVEDHTNEIENILDPQKFMERHFGAEN